MDRAQLPKGYRATTRRHLLLATKFPEIPGTHLIDFTKMERWVDLGATQWFWILDWKPIALTTAQLTTDREPEELGHWGNH